MAIDISSMTLSELKALAYDLKMELESVTGNLEIVQRQISLKVQQEAEANAAEQRKKDEEMDVVVPPSANDATPPSDASDSSAKDKAPKNDEQA